MTVRIQKLDQEARVPEYAHQGDAGMDMFSLTEVTLAPGARTVVPTGVAMQVPEGFVALVWDKSGRAVKDGVTTLAGVIDSGYRGEVGIVLLNTSDQELVIEKHQKVAQILIQPVHSAQLEVVESLEDSDRGEGGFGSTGLT